MKKFLKSILGIKAPELDRDDPLGSVCQYVHGNPTAIEGGFAFPIRSATPELITFVDNWLNQDGNSIQFKPDPQQREKITILEVTGETANQLRDALTEFRNPKTRTKADMSWSDFARNGNKIRQGDPAAIYDRVLGRPEFDTENGTVKVVFDLTGADHWVGEVIADAFPKLKTIPLSREADVQQPEIPQHSNKPKLMGLVPPRSTEESVVLHVELSGADAEKFSKGYAANLVAQADAVKAPSR